MITLLRNITLAIFYLKNEDKFASVANVVLPEDVDKAKALQAGLDQCEQAKTAPSQAMIDTGNYLFQTYLTPKWS